MLHFVQQVDEDVGLAHAVGVEILPYSQSQLVFVLPSFRFRSRHCRRHSSDRAAEYDVAEGVLEGGGRVEAVGSAVTLKKGAVLRCPRYLGRSLVSEMALSCLLQVGRIDYSLLKRSARSGRW